ncbi:MAG: deoxyribodipyrimidine photo-lyase [Bacteroidetes bacterium]|nr:deoxyribodipyrimidine photo-lyase [Bacteroidota bacterium]
MPSVFIFHRDFRLYDNTAFIECCKTADTIIPIFIFPPEQIDNTKNKYFSHPAVQFMIESLLDLKEELGKLYFYREKNVATFQHLYKQVKFDKVYSNKDFSPYALKRDDEIKKWCSSNNVEYFEYEDYDLIENSGKIYSVLAPYYNKFAKGEYQVNKPRNHTQYKIYHLSDYKEPDIKEYYKANDNIKVHGGRKEALKILELVKHKKFKDYQKERDYPALNGTTLLSAYLKFGCISVRELYWILHDTSSNALIRELVFRSFYYRIYSNKLELLKGKAYHDDVDKKIPWTTNKKWFNAWITGKTGFPMADAGMRQLTGENWVHNRVRMLVANVATKYLLLDWRLCLKYFYKNLVDADIFSNTAGWQWGAGIGVDSAPYFRAPFNTFTQSYKFDRDCEYIKKWIPELKDVDNKDIHKWYDEKIRNKYPECKYPAPIVNQKDASKKAIELWHP